MPTFLDITGLEDEESEINKEMLRILFRVRQYYFNNGQNIQKLRRLLVLFYLELYSGYIDSISYFGNIAENVSMT
jgi:hypothetical protein